MKVLSLIKTGLFASLLLAPLAQAEDLKLGFAHLERAINEVDEGVQAKADLKKEFDKKQALLDKKQNEAKALLEDAEKQSAVLSNEAKQKKMMEVQKKGAEVQQLYVNMQQDMMKRQNEVMGGIMQKMNTVLSNIATDGGYTFILNKSESSVLYGKPALDVTNEVIRRYNETYSKKSGKAKS